MANFSKQTNIGNVVFFNRITIDKSLKEVTDEKYDSRFIQTNLSHVYF